MAQQEEKNKKKPSFPVFGVWDDEGVPYTELFDDARERKDRKKQGENPDNGAVGSPMFSPLHRQHPKTFATRQPTPAVGGHLLSYGTPETSTNMPTEQVHESHLEEEKNKKKPSFPVFGLWDDEGVPYTELFDDARERKDRQKQEEKPDNGAVGSLQTSPLHPQHPATSDTRQPAPPGGGHRLCQQDESNTSSDPRFNERLNLLRDGRNKIGDRSQKKRKPLTRSCNIL